ncbi:MAG: SpoIVB peptidase S55 domain-containing protein [Acidobacteriota bacterium]
MKKLFLSTILIPFLLQSSSIMSLKDVKPGMVGKGKTVFEGRKIETFDVEIVGILKNVFPNQSLIIANLKGDMAQKAGVVSGMSGSPVYIEDKLIGSISYSFPWAKDSIAGITPIEEMIEVSKEPEIKKSFSALNIPLKKYLNFEDFKSMFNILNPEISFNYKGNVFYSLPVPLSISNASNRLMEKLNEFSSSLRFIPVNAGISANAVDFGNLSSLEEGQAIAVQIVKGDLDISAVGTVTHVDGEKVYAFGHPLFNLGGVEFPMAEGEILAVVPKLDTSFKLSTSGKTIGVFNQDRFNGVFGIIGKVPSLIPLKIELVKENGKEKSYNFEIVNNKLLAPFFTFVTILNTVEIVSKSLGDISYSLRGEVFLEEGKSVKIEDYFSGEGKESIENISILPAAVLYYLMNNEFKDVKISKVNLKIGVEESIEIAKLERIWVEENEVKPNQRLKIRVFFRTWRGDIKEEEAQISIPNFEPDTPFEIIVGDAETLTQYEIKEYRGGEMPRSLELLIRALNNIRKNNRIYFKLRTKKHSLFFRGEEFSNVPSLINEVISSTRLSISPVDLNFSTVREYQLPIDFVFKGFAKIPLRVKK